MIYVLGAMILLLSACSLIYVSGTGEQPVNIQTTDPISVMSSQNVVSSDKSADGDVSSEDSNDQKAKATPTVPVNIGPPLP
jgi:uncharacterized lipoprotein YajG